MRLVVTGHDAEGRSTVASDTEVADRGLAMLFTASCRDGDLPEVPGPHIDTVPPPGSARWLVVGVSPEARMRESLRAGVPGIDPEGWHATPTTDFVMILDGTVTLALDTGEVELHAGDAVVQRATRHAWRNRSDRVVRMSAVMITPQGPPAGPPGPPGASGASG